MGKHAADFRRLGYRIFRLEPVFLLAKGGKCNPDMVLSSSKKGHALVVEWTNATNVYDDKKGQLHRYSRLTRSDLINALAVPAKEAQTFDVVLIVSVGASDTFRKYLDDSAHEFVLFSFAAAEAASKLAKIVGTLSEDDTERFFSRAKSFRIPLRYIPFALDNPSATELVTPIVAHCVSLMVRGTKEFTIDEFCSGFVNAWNVIAPDKRHEISRRTKEVLDRLAHKPVGVELLARQPKANPPAWQLLKSPIGQTNARALRSRLQDFIFEVKGATFQMDLPFDE